MAINFTLLNYPRSSREPSPKPVLFITDIEYLIKFAQGDIGIADGIQKKMLMKNIGKMKNVEQLKTFTKATGTTLNKPHEQYLKDGRIQVPPGDISMGVGSGNLGGLKSLEKALITSIFETQKPYIEVAKIVLNNFVLIEDIIARVLAFGGSSAKPIGNPAALGYGGTNSFSKSLGKLDSLSNIRKPTQTSGTNSNTGLSQSSQSDVTTYDYLPNGYTAITQSIAYSTGVYEEGVDYKYEYRYIKDDSINLPDTSEDQSIPTDDDGKPDNVVFAVYTVGTSSNQFTPLTDDQVKTRLPWLYNSGKWYGNYDQIITNNDVTRNYYLQYFLDDASRKMDKQGLTQSQKDSALEQLKTMLTTVGGDVEPTPLSPSVPSMRGVTMLQSHVDNIIKYGFLPVSNTTNTSGLSSIPQAPYYNINHAYEAKQINGPSGSIWIDPDSEYDMKFIKCDSSTDIKYTDVSGTEKTTSIIRFIKSNLTISLSNNDKFYYSLTGNNIDIPKTGTFNQISWDNIDLTQSYLLEIRYYKIPEEFKSGYTFYDNYYTYNLVNNNGVYTLQRGTGDVNNIFNVDDYYNPSFLRFPNGKVLFFTNLKFDYVQVYANDLVSLLPTTLQKNTVTINLTDLSVSQNRIDIPPTEIRVKDSTNPFGKIIDRNQITNKQLQVDTLYSTGLYGTPTQGVDGNNKTINANQDIKQIYRYMTNEDDTETYYIVEGVLSSKNKNPISSIIDQAEGSVGGGYYHIKDVIRSIKPFISLMIQIFSKLIPSIELLIELIKNPSSFVLDIITDKFGTGVGLSNFGFFSKDFINDLKKVGSKSKTNPTPSDVKEMKSYVKGSTLKNYVYITDAGVAKFILDGMSSVKLFGDLIKLPGLKFGLKVQLSSLLTNNPQIPFLPILGGSVPSSDKTLAEILGISHDIINQQMKLSVLANSNTSYNSNLSTNTFTTQAGSNVYSEDVSIQYSTGVYIPGVDYTYIYVTDYVRGLLVKSGDYESQGDYPSAIDALNDAQKSDPNNKFIKDKISELKKLLSKSIEGIALSGVQPILNFILSMVTLPLKLVLGIVQYIMNFFKGLTNPFELPSKIVEFVSFKWMGDFFNPMVPSSLFGLAGIKFDIQKYILEWIPGAKMGTKTNFDMNQISKLPWTNQPTYKLDQIKSMIFPNSSSPKMIPLLQLNGILGIFEGIFNGIVDFIWALFGIGGIINPPPHIKLTKETNGDLNPSDIMNLLNGNYFKSGTQSFNTNSNGDFLSTNIQSTNFVYEIKTSDGRDIRDLNQDELQKWMEENKNFQFIFDF
jgi:hypothetical protein